MSSRPVNKELENVDLILFPIEKNVHVRQKSMKLWAFWIVSQSSSALDFVKFMPSTVIVGRYYQSAKIWKYIIWHLLQIYPNSPYNKTFAL